MTANPVPASMAVFRWRAMLILLSAVVLSPGPAAGSAEFDDDWNLTTNPPHIFNMNTGNLGIGTTTPEAKLDLRIGLVLGAESSPALAVRRNVRRIFPTPGTTLVTDFLIDDGRVGIGETSPQAKLHVHTADQNEYAIRASAPNLNGNTPALLATTANGIAVQGISLNGRAALFHAAGPENGSPALHVQHMGVGPAGDFAIMKTNNPSTALVAKTRGTGSAALFQVNNSDSHADAVVISTAGTGRSLRVPGITSVDVLEIEGGSDLSEGFHIGSDGVEPGMVVVIDPENPGRLMPSTTEYDRRVAGIVSGAGGVRPGMMMRQSGTLATGEYPIALSGRVYCLADASLEAIQPGSLLTTAGTPGHAMKVTDHTRAPGAVIGKAMTALPKGERGLVLVLVSLQ